MKNKIKIKFNKSEVRSLLAIFMNYNIRWIVDKHSRFMVEELLGRLQKKLIASIDNKEANIGISYAQAAAFDLAFRLTPVQFLEDAPFIPLYEEILINRIINEINKVI